MDTCLVFRSRLEDLVGEFDRSRLVLLSGPAGIGKTVLMARWHAIARNRGMSVGWRSLLQDGLDPKSVLADLSEVFERDGQPVILFLDDYQAVTDPTIHRDINLMLSTLPASHTLVIAARSEPPLPLERYRACGALLELGAADLRFTLDEARYYLTRVQALDLSEDQIREVTEKTGGCASALQLAVLTRRVMAKERDALPEIQRRANRWLERFDADDEGVLRGFAAVMVGYAAGTAVDIDTAISQCREAIETSGRVLETLRPDSARSAPAASDQLHHREVQILRLVSEGLRNREIGERLRISEDTVKWYLKRLFAKLYVTTRTSAVARGRELGFLP
ncbi:hypothetical protein N825_27185 [Skermanella stibiiresistens SB22]|uniref:HTH luxR-type domain-containing protein n=1 Tax=Skermanella stibiiresistens SB22 TaxID=1385369 RepID=W9H9T9_9PROT|nr:LuxR C-terminal-related transcriptional regulator [Skermanella stibiiresistens]EWY41472.1 hypothetical protein N825_27185 [Skermanella stibiiresistens SB22]